MVDFGVQVRDLGRIVADYAYMVEGASMASIASLDPDHVLVECPVYHVLSGSRDKV